MLEVTVLEAYRKLHTPADKILSDPDVRARFLKLVRHEVPDADEKSILALMLRLRKRGRLPRLVRT